MRRTGPRPLRKVEVEELLAALRGRGAPVEVEVAELRDAVTAALRVVLGRPEDGWDELVRHAATTGGWSAVRLRALRTAGAEPHEVEPTDLEWARSALWELAAELNEERVVRGAGGAAPG